MKKLLPLLSLCSATAIVAPIVTSCSHDINVNMEWYEQAQFAIGYYKAEQSIVQKQLYKIHIDLSIAEWELDYAANNFRFSYAAKSKDGSTKNVISAPDIQHAYLNGELKTNWVLTLATQNSGDVYFETEDGEINQNSKIDVEIMYDIAEGFEPFTACFQFDVDHSTK